MEGLGKAQEVTAEKEIAPFHSLRVLFLTSNPLLQVFTE